MERRVKVRGRDREHEIGAGCILAFSIYLLRLLHDFLCSLLSRCEPQRKRKKPEVDEKSLGIRAANRRLDPAKVLRGISAIAHIRSSRNNDELETRLGGSEQCFEVVERGQHSPDDRRPGAIDRYAFERSRCGLDIERLQRIDYLDTAAVAGITAGRCLTQCLDADLTPLELLLADRTLKIGNCCFEPR